MQWSSSLQKKQYIFILTSHFHTNPNMYSHTSKNIAPQCAIRCIQKNRHICVALCTLWNNRLSFIRGWFHQHLQGILNVDRNFVQDKVMTCRKFTFVLRIVGNVRWFDKIIHVLKFREIIPWSFISLCCSGQEYMIVASTITVYITHSCPVCYSMTVSSPLSHIQPPKGIWTKYFFCLTTWF